MNMNFDRQLPEGKWRLRVYYDADDDDLIEIAEDHLNNDGYIVEGGTKLYLTPAQAVWLYAQLGHLIDSWDTHNDGRTIDSSAP
jgi:hypothetical protein